MVDGIAVMFLEQPLGAYTGDGATLSIVEGDPDGNP